MTDVRAELLQRRDQVLGDLADLDRQLADGELSAHQAAELRRRYEHEALEVLRAIRAASGDSAQSVAAAPRRRLGARHLPYLLGAAAAVAAVVLVPANAVDRPDGGLVTGNDMLVRPPSGAASAAADSGGRRAGGALAAVTDAQLEAAVAANPQVTPMRLALAVRYLEQGRPDLAVVHLTKVLEQDPQNAEALAHLGWLMLQVGRPERAVTLLDQALRADPELGEALWFQANVRLYGLNDPAGALKSLDRLVAVEAVSATVRRQAQDLRAVARRRLQGSQ